MARKKAVPVRRLTVSRGSRLLKEWRGTKTQEESAYYIGIDHGAYCAFETGYRSPGNKRAERIAERTGGMVPADSWKTPAGKSKS